MGQRVTLILALALLIGCAHTSEQSLYSQLGGDEGIARIVDEVIELSRNDERIGFLFEETDFPYFRERLIEQICELSGGPCEYTGLDMQAAHSGMEITRAEFNYFVEDLEIAMNRAGIPIGAQNRLVALLAPMRPDIIEQ